MRRLITAALLALFVCQSSGAAIAAPAAASSAPSLLAQIQFAFAQTFGSLQTTHIGAFLSGKEHQYEAMHSAPPDFTETRKVHEHANPDFHRMMVAPIYHPGIPGNVPPPPGPPDLKNIKRDPLAMKSSAAPASATRKSELFHAASIAKPAFATQQLHASGPMTVGAGNGSGTTGINRWWTYEEGALPGVGKWMANVATGNLIIQENDIDLPERGVDLAFRRTYNSQSQHDYANTDGSVPSNFGNGWTNTFDAHLSYNASTNVMTIYDIDGARYDYTSDGQGHWIAPPGMQGTNLFLSGACGYDWQKKNGTIYTFWLPYSSSNCGPSQSAGYRGRELEIFGRNYNNWIRFDYYWDNGDASTSAHLNEINVVHSDGQTLMLKFADFNGYRELSYFTRPDGVAVTYGYDSSGDLTSVTLPTNNSAYATHTYGYATNYFAHIMAWVASPLWNQTNAAKGSYNWFNYDGNIHVIWVQLYGWGNFTPNDGTGQALQPSAAQQAAQMSATSFSYPSSSETQLTDTDGHATNWFYDGSGRVTETQEWTGAPNNLWLSTYASWDGSNNLTETVDARGNATDYGYDGNGNTIWTQAPWITTSMGYGRPVARYSYDQYNNLVAYCDPQYVWTTGATSCNASSGVTRYSWSSNINPDASEPYGCLMDTFTPLGYHRHIAYSGSAPCGDYGLPTSVTGDAISQNDGTGRQPTMTLTYDPRGNVTQENTGDGTWTVSYDQYLNRVTAATDPDGITTRTCYYQNGQISARQTALQYSMDGGVVCGSHSTTFTYDADGNEISETNHVNNTADTTNKWYDGADRLVEVEVPYDSSDIYQNAWMTRYIYDLTQGGTVSLSGSASVSYRAYGNLYKTQELLMPSTSQEIVWNNTNPKLANTSFQDTNGTAFDALDRPVTKYQFVGDVPHGETETYDQNGYYGDATGHCNSASSQQCASMTYYTTDAVDQVTYNDGTPSETATYDPDGRLATQASSAFGTQSYTYDADSRLTSDVEPSGGGVSSPATLTYHYYADGMRSALDVNSSALNQASLFAYAYRTDGKLQTQQINYAANAKVGNSALHFTYTNAGKLTQRTESGPAANPTAISFQYDGSTGVMTTANYPAAALSGFSYDADGQIETYNQNIYGYTSGPSSVGTFTYTARGESKIDPRGGGSTVYANGTGISYSGTSQWYGRSGARMNGGSPYYDPNGNANGTAFSYDNAGRQIESDQAGSDHYGFQWDITNARTYDAQNHVTESVQSDPNSFYRVTGTNNTIAVYNWGPNGHPIRIGSSPSVSNATPTLSQVTYDTLHWDGNQLLFTTNANGQVDDIKVGAIGDITPLDSGFTGLTFWDRLAGALAFCHNASGAGGEDVVPSSGSSNAFTGPYMKNYGCVKASGQTMSLPASIIWQSDGKLAGGVGRGGVLGMERSDGISDGANTIQGVRAFDSVQGQWTTPDAYAGDLHDPSTQKSYMWNGNNPVAYSDPTGYLFGENAGAGLYQDALAGNALKNQPDDDAEDTNDKIAAAIGASGSNRLKADPGWNAVDQAALAATRAFHDITQITGMEFGGRIVCNQSGTSCTYSVSPDSGKNQCSATECHVDVVSAPVLPGLHTFAFWHTHPSKFGASSEYFSSEDYGFSIGHHLPLYVGTPEGKLERTAGFNAPLAEFKVGAYVLLCDSCAK